MTLNDKDALLAELYECRYFTGNYDEALKLASLELRSRVFWWIGRHVVKPRSLRFFQHHGD